jgi:serine/threonine protein kinase
MTPEQWARIVPIVHSALTRDVDGRAAFVADACGDDADLRREVDSLLARASEVDDFLSAAAAELTVGASEKGPLVGDRIGPYAIEGRLGAGGMGEVYRARDVNLDRDVAIKMLPQVLTADADRVARFEREARILAALNHPRIGAIYGLEHMDGVPALVLELVEGSTLAERLASGALPVVEAVTIAIEIAEALEAAHDRGIIHRDIKPANIKITPAGAVKVLDFGLAKDVARHGDDLFGAATWIARAFDVSSPGAVLGTIAYMSPEQAAGEEIDTRTDLFSLGAVLYEMVTARRAFDSPPSPRDANPSVPPALEQVILRLLERSRDARYQTASAVRADLMHVAADIEAGASAGSLSTRRLRRIVVAVAVVCVAGLGAWMWPRLVPRASARSEYTQVTHFADSATSPALSPDGRLLTFIRGDSTFEGLGQVYLKELPDGDSVQLTSDRSAKMSPVFSPDGSRIAYTSVSNEFVWDTWLVPVAGRTPRLWLANASGLMWVGDRHVLFSEITTGLHMKVVSADDRREMIRDVYSPESPQGMAHRSSPSPDGAWVLIAEMVRPVWQRCRLVAMNGRTSRRVGPEGQCTSAAWSPDGAWMYFSSNTSGSFHIWRQRFPDGTPEQISFGPGEEEGVAVSPDGRSLLTSIGLRQSSIWVRDASGEREVSPEGYAFIPAIPNSGMSQPFAANGRLLYLVRQGAVRFAGPGERAGELWQTDLHTSQSAPLFPGVRVSGFDVSRDGRQIVFAALDGRGTSHIWLGRTDRSAEPRQLSTLEADSPHFGAGGSVYYRSSEGGTSFIYRMSAGGDSQKAVARPVVFFLSVSPDDAWLVARVEAAPGADSTQENLAFPTTPGAPPVRLCPMECEVDWTPNGKSLVVRLAATGSPFVARTFIVPLRPGETLPHLPPYGIRSEADLAGVRISHVVDGSVYPADEAPLVAFVRSTTERNIYRIPVP